MHNQRRTPFSPRPLSALRCLAPTTLLAAMALAPTAAAQPTAEPPLIGCDRAAQLIVLTSSARLDPSCVYTRGVEIRASGVTLDCQGALIQDVAGNRGRGIYIGGPEDEALSDILVRGCEVEGFLNNFRVEREGFKALPEGGEYETLFSNIVLEDSQLYRSRGSGIFINAYVTGVTLRRLEIADSEGVAVYLEAGSKENTLEDSYLHHNGFDASTWEPMEVEVGPATFVVQIEGREGLAIDGARFSTVRGNVFEANAAGGIFFYKNCGEHVHTNPDGHWERWYGADGNLIEGNTFYNEKQGVWIGSRMAQNQIFMDCSDPHYVRGPVWRVYRDYAADNTVRGNAFIDVGNAIRVEDDGALIEDNTIASDDPSARAVIVGTLFRTRELGEPVLGTQILGNHAQITGNAFPYTWIHGHEGTVFEGNTSGQSEAVLTAGDQPPMTFHLFVNALSLASGPRAP